MSPSYTHCEMDGCSSPIAVGIPMPPTHRAEPPKWVCLAHFTEYRSAVDPVIEQLVSSTKRQKGR